MDYNFNLKHTQRKFRMPPLMQPSNLERCFSTSSGIKMTTCMSNKLTANPLINLISEFHNQIPTMCSISSGGNQMTSSLFSATTSMSVSCSTSSFVGGGGVNKTPKTPTYCDELILDALLNSHLPYENTQKTTAAKGSDLTNINAQRTRRRTYAEVTKEKPKPRGLVNCVTTGVQSILPTSCDNFTILRHSQSVEFGTMNPNPKQDQVTGITRVCSETMVVPRNAKRLSSSSSESSTEPGKMNGRTFSECSVDSDDSFILFQHDDDGKVCDYSEEESSEDDDESEEVCGIKYSLSAIYLLFYLSDFFIIFMILGDPDCSLL